MPCRWAGISRFAQACICLHSMPLWTFAEPFMRKTTAKLHESCSAAILSDEDMVYVARARAAHNCVDLQVCGHLPAHRTAMECVLLSGLKELISKHYWRGQRSYSALSKLLSIGLHPIAVPLRDHSNTIIAAINVSTQTSRQTLVDMEAEILTIFRDMEQRIGDFSSCSSQAA